MAARRRGRFEDHARCGPGHRGRTDAFGAALVLVDRRRAARKHRRERRRERIRRQAAVRTRRLADPALRRGLGEGLRPDAPRSALLRRDKRAGRHPDAGRAARVPPERPDSDRRRAVGRRAAHAAAVARGARAAGQRQGPLAEDHRRAAGKSARKLKQTMARPVGPRARHRRAVAVAPGQRARRAASTSSAPARCPNRWRWNSRPRCCSPNRRSSISARSRRSCRSRSTRCWRASTPRSRTSRRRPVADAPLLDEMARRAQERLLLAQVAREIQANLRHMEQVLDAFFRDNSKRADLATLAGDSRQIAGALKMLGLDSAERLLELCQHQIDEYAKPDAPVHNDDLEMLAESLSGLGFYIEAVEQQRPDRDRLITPLLDRRLGVAPSAPAAELETVESAVVDLRSALPRDVCRLSERARRSPRRATGSSADLTTLRARCRADRRRAPAAGRRCGARPARACRHRRHRGAAGCRRGGRRRRVRRRAGAFGGNDAPARNRRDAVRHRAARHLPDRGRRGAGHGRGQRARARRASRRSHGADGRATRIPHAEGQRPDGGPDRSGRARVRGREGSQPRARGRPPGDAGGDRADRRRRVELPPLGRRAAQHRPGHARRRRPACGARQSRKRVSRCRRRRSGTAGRRRTATRRDQPLRRPTNTASAGDAAASPPLRRSRSSSSTKRRTRRPTHGGAHRARCQVGTDAGLSARRRRRRSPKPARTSPSPADAEEEITVGGVTLSAALYRILCEEAKQHLATLDAELQTLAVRSRGDAVAADGARQPHAVRHSSHRRLPAGRHDGQGAGSLPARLCRNAARRFPARRNRCWRARSRA